MVTAASIAALGDRQALWALDYVGRVVAAGSGSSPTLLARKVTALPGFDPAAVPTIAHGHVVGGAEAEARAGRIARHALTGGLADERPEVRRAIASAVSEISEPAVPQEAVTMLLIGGAVLLGLAILAKLEVTAAGEVVLHPGLPDIDEAGKAVGSLVGAALKSATGAG